MQPDSNAHSGLQFVSRSWVHGLDKPGSRTNQPSFRFLSPSKVRPLSSAADVTPLAMGAILLHNHFSSF